MKGRLIQTQSQNIKKIKKTICPYCDRKLKPAVRMPEDQEHYIVYECRYCRIEIKVSDIKNGTIPKKFDELFVKKRNEKIKQCKYGPEPNECVYCYSKKIQEYPENYTWECLDCEEIFEWHSYEVSFTGEISLAAKSKHHAIIKAYKFTDDLDCEATEVDR
ncbi:MAG: hypothetical protein GF317_20785 [Candidatus Lokiarchaeota archaeon]|nr:hypothetical protein [Candidatus Lokiarchaeota archaeon]